jgi:hypothetical protein
VAFDVEDIELMPNGSGQMLIRRSDQAGEQSRIESGRARLEGSPKSLGRWVVLDTERRADAAFYGGC